MPNGNDSIWLECTSKNSQAGVLGSFTENKNALLLTEKGGVLIQTPESKPINNLLNTKTVIDIKEDGGSAVTSSLSCSGDFWNIFYEIGMMNNDDQKSAFNRYLGYRSPDNFALVQQQTTHAAAAFTLNLGYSQAYSFKAGSKLFFDQHIHNSLVEPLPPGDRKKEYLFQYPYQKNDTTVFVLPEGMAIDQLPAEKIVDTRYVLYNSQAAKSEDGRQLTIVYHFEIKHRVIPPEDYAAVVKSLDEIKRHESQKFILRKL